MSYDDQLEQELQQEDRLEEEVRPERDARQQLKLNDELDKNRKILLHLNQWDPGTIVTFLAFPSFVLSIDYN